QLQRAHPGTLRKFLQKHNCRNQEKNVERIAAIQEAVSATQDQAVREACGLTTRSLEAILATLRAQIAMFDERIAELVPGPDEPSEKSHQGALKGVPKVGAVSGWCCEATAGEDSVREAVPQGSAFETGSGSNPHEREVAIPLTGARVAFDHGLATL